jgi:hypothetical protein
MLNKFLAPNLQTPIKKIGSASATFEDNRVKTTTPIPFIETIVAPYRDITGYVVEPNSYIYIYINGFLINPPIYDNKTRTYDSSAVLSDSNGQWQITSSFFDTFPDFLTGQVIVFRAKAPLQKISDYSIPYKIGGPQTPIELGVIGEYGVLRTPYAGESSITGRISYWLDHPSQNSERSALPVFGYPMHVFVYIDGIHVSNADSSIGEVYPNEIRGVDVTFPIGSITGPLSLIVNGKQIDIPINLTYTLNDLDYIINYLHSLDEINNNLLRADSINGQLRIISPYTLELKQFGPIENALFGSKIILYPGKDDNGEFRFWFNPTTSYWKWTNYDPTTEITSPFITGQRVTARLNAQ